MSTSTSTSARTRSASKRCVAPSIAGPVTAGGGGRVLERAVGPLLGLVAGCQFGKLADSRDSLGPKCVGDHPVDDGLTSSRARDPPRTAPTNDNHGTRRSGSAGFRRVGRRSRGAAQVRCANSSRRGPTSKTAMQSASIPMTPARHWSGARSPASPAATNNSVRCWRRCWSRRLGAVRDSRRPWATRSTAGWSVSCARPRRCSVLRPVWSHGGSPRSLGGSRCRRAPAARRDHAADRARRRVARVPDRAPRGRGGQGVGHRRSRGPSSTITKAVGPWSLWIDREQVAPRSRCSAAASLRRRPRVYQRRLPLLPVSSASCPGPTGAGIPKDRARSTNTAVGFRVNVLTLCASTPPRRSRGGASQPNRWVRRRA